MCAHLKHPIVAHLVNSLPYLSGPSLLPFSPLLFSILHSAHSFHFSLLSLTIFSFSPIWLIGGWLFSLLHPQQIRIHILWSNCTLVMSRSSHFGIVWFTDRRFTTKNYEWKCCLECVQINTLCNTSFISLCFHLNHPIVGSYLMNGRVSAYHFTSVPFEYVQDKLNFWWNLLLFRFVQNEKLIFIVTKQSKTGHNGLF